MTEGKIRAIIVLEILGRPAEYIKESLGNIVKQLGEEKDTSVISKKIHEPKKLEEGDIYSTFAELEIETELLPLLRMVFIYMPSHIDILSPEELRMRNYDISLVVNELVKKLHQYDEIAKRIIIEKNILEEQLRRAGIKPATEQMQEQQQRAQQQIPAKKEKKAKKRTKGKKK